MFSGQLMKYQLYKICDNRIYTRGKIYLYLWETLFYSILIINYVYIIISILDITVVFKVPKETVNDFPK